MKIEFSKVFENNYIKMISNIFYLNLRKAQKTYKDEYVDKADLSEAAECKKIFDSIYKKTLKETRIEVEQFFKVPQNELLPFKICLRIYPYYFSRYHHLRIEYEEINEDVNKTITKLLIVNCINELYNEENQGAILKPTDIKIDFYERFLKKNNIDLNNKNENSDRILNKFDKAYSNKKSDSDEENNEDID